MIFETKTSSGSPAAGPATYVPLSQLLKGMSPEGLQNQLVESLRIAYGVADIDRGGSFLRHCLHHLHECLARPCRENVYDRIKVGIVGPSLLRITEEETYKCRRIGDCVENIVAWQANSKEILLLEDLKLKLRWPSEPGQSRRKTVLGIEDLAKKPLADGSLHYECDLGSSGGIDGLTVCREATYLVHLSSFNTWKAGGLSCGLEIWISYPPELDLQFLPYHSDNEPGECSHDRGEFYALFKSWTLPNSGFAWKLVPAGLPDTVQIGKKGGRKITLEDILEDAAD